MWRNKKNMLSKIFAGAVALAMVVGMLPVYSQNVKAAGNKLMQYSALYPDAKVINVTSVGVSNSGSGDVGNVLSAKIAEINKTSQEGDIVIFYFPAGRYTLNSHINAKISNAFFIADDNAVFTAKSKISDGMIRFPKNYTNNTISGGTWDGGKKANSAVSLNNNDKIIMEDMTVKNTVDSGLRVLVSDDALIRNVNITTPGKKGIYVTTNSTAEIQNAYVNKATENGIRLNKSTATVTGCEVFNSGLNGISATDKNSKVYINNCTINKNGTKKQSTGHGVAISYGAYSEIKGTTIKSNKQCGISVYGSKAKVVIENSNVSSNARHGIGAAEKSIVVTKKCTFNSNKWHGVMARDNARITVEDCTLSKNKVAGVCVDNAKSAVINDNTITKNNSNGVYLANGSAKLKNNTITGNKAFGIFAWEGRTSTLVSGNVIKSNKKGDLATDSGAKVVIKKGNKVSNIR